MNTASQGAVTLLAQLRAIVGDAHVLCGDKPTRRFRKGYRFGDGPVLAVVRPGTLLEQWRVLQAVVAADAVVIMQAANTGLSKGARDTPPIRISPTIRSAA